MTYEFDVDTAITQVAPDTWSGTITDRWSIGNVPNGGYVLAIATRAIGQALPNRDPLSVTAHYLRACKPGPIEVIVETIKTGRRLGTAMARMRQEGHECVRVLATFAADRTRREADLVYVAGTPPALPPIDRAVIIEQPKSASLPATLAIADRLDVRYAPDTAALFAKERSGVPEVRAWLRFADGRPTDVTSLALFVDALPPPVLHLVSLPWVPTLELTMHVREKPAPGWLRVRFATRFVQRGYLESDGEVWDETGTLVAQSRQLMTIPESR